ncbi:MAG TPA: hypothetical protein VES73_04965 [Lamprocystis sp. (in: g-proteobacteria)]|nr:hypothetical protein [Lamprocystis sp. (in: g-proteobacteria)]
MKIDRLRGRFWGSAPSVIGIGLLLHCAGALAVSCPAPSNNSIFNATLCVDGQVFNVGADRIVDIIDAIDTDQLRQRFTNYDEDVSPGEFRIDLRGLPVTINYDQNSTLLAFSVPSLNINETFDGGTRDASNDLFEEYLKQNGQDILRELLRVSAVDPLAGNPASLQSQMVDGDFAAGMDAGGAPGGSFGVGARFGSFGLDRFTQNVYTLPISYTYTFANHDSLMVQIPLSYIEVEGAAAYRGQLGLSYKKIISTRWALTPSLGYGISGSSDVGSLGHILSFSLTSDLLLFNNGKFSLSMGNLLGYYLTLPVRIGDYSVDYELKNTITRNGLLLSMPLQKRWWGREFSLDVFVTGTWFFGDALYTDNYQEIGISIGPRRSADKRSPNLGSHPFGLGLKYIHAGSNIDGVELNFGYRF